MLKFEILEYIDQFHESNVPKLIFVRTDNMPSSINIKELLLLWKFPIEDIARPKLSNWRI